MTPGYGVTAYAGAQGGRFRLFAPLARNEVLRQRFADFCARRTRAATPLRMHEFENVVLEDSPTGACLYDAHGRRIAESCVIRYADDLTPEFWRARETIDARPVRDRIETPVVYHGAFFRHWGHFLLETMSRAWAASDLPAVFAWSLGAGAPGPNYRRFLDAAGVDLLNPEGEPRKIGLSRCFVPEASFATVGYAEPAHLAAAHRVAGKLSNGAARDPRPVYFTRANFKPHAEARPAIRNEGELEQALAARGARIVLMETLSLAEQVDVMNAHRVFIGPWGSALHNTVFSLNGAAVSTFVLIGRFLPTNFMLVDTIVGNAAHYLVTLARASDFEESRQVEVDVEATLAYLAANGAI